MEEILYIIQIALKGLNLDRKTQIEILDFIKQKVTPSTLTLGNALLTVRNLQKYCQKFQNIHQYEQKVILCQSVIRGWLTRKRTRSLLQKCVTETNPSRANLLKELLTAETKYHSILKHLVHDFFKPMLSRAKKSASFISVDDVNALFGNIEALESFHMAFITRFQQFLNNNISSYTIGQFFMEMIPSLGLYSDYALNFRFALNTLEKCRSQEKFTQFVNEIEEKSQFHLNLSSLLQTPLNHLSMYTHHIELLLHETPTDDIDYEKLWDVFFIMTRLSLFVQECFAQSKTFAQIQDIQRRFVPVQPQLVKLGRTLLKEIPIKFAVDDRRRLKRGVFFIFNDIYVIAQETKSSTTSQQLLQLITILPINQTSLQADVQMWNNSIGLHNKQESYVICFETKLVKERAYKIIYNIVTQRENFSKKFTAFDSIKIEEWIQREPSPDGIPTTLRKIISRLRGAVTTEMLCNAVSLYTCEKSLQIQEFVGQEGTNLDFSSQPIDRVAIMLIAFFKDLAQPLLPQELYNQIVQFKFGEERSSTRTRYLIHSFLKPEIRYIFKYIIEFFREICYKEVSERSRSFKKINISKEPHPSSITSENTSESNNFIVDTPPISDNTDSNQTNTNTHNNNNNLSPTTRTNKTTAKETPVSKVPIQNREPSWRARKIAVFIGPILFGTTEWERSQSATTDLVVAATNLAKVCRFLVNLIQHFHFVFSEQSTNELFQYLHNYLNQEMVLSSPPFTKENN